jgi:hypothetical protein
MKYELPEAEYMGDDIFAFTVDQMLAAYQAGVDSVRYEGELPELPALDHFMLGLAPYIQASIESYAEDYAHQAIAGALAKVGQSEAVWFHKLGVHGEHRFYNQTETQPEGCVPLYATPQPAPAAQPLKERPDFIAGYDAGMADAKRMQRLEAQPLELSNGEIYTAYIEAANQTLRPQDERIALAFAHAILAAANKKAGL